MQALIYREKDYLDRPVFDNKFILTAGGISTSGKKFLYLVLNYYSIC